MTLTVPAIRYSGYPATLPSAHAARNDWHAQAACANDDTGADWYATDTEGTARAIAICHTCPVIDACRAAGADDTHGIWGGTTPKERAQA